MKSLLLLLTIIVHNGYSARQDRYHYDVIELNRVFNEDKSMDFYQIIFWNWHPEIQYVDINGKVRTGCYIAEDWVNYRGQDIKKDFSNNTYYVNIEARLRRFVTMKVTANSFRKTETKQDLESINRQVFPRVYRKKLSEY